MMDWWILEPVNPRLLRPRLLRGPRLPRRQGVFVGDHVRIDLNHADRIRIEDHVHIAAGCRLLCHQRDLRGYYVGGDYARLGYRYGEIRLGRGCLIGMESFVLPGVTVGEGGHRRRRVARNEATFPPGPLRRAARPRSSGTFPKNLNPCQS